MTFPALVERMNNVSSCSAGPATLPYSLSANIVNSDNIPLLTNKQSSPAITAPSSDELLVPHSSSAEQINALPILHLFPTGGS